MKTSKALRLQPKTYILIILILAICIMGYIFYKNEVNMYRREGFGGGIIRGVSDETLQRNTDKLTDSQKLVIYSILNSTMNDDLKVFLLFIALAVSGIGNTKYNEIMFSPYYLPWMSQVMTYSNLPPDNWAKKSERERGYVQFSVFDYRFNDYKYFQNNSRKIFAMNKITINGKIIGNTLTCKQLDTNPPPVPASSTPVIY